MKRCTKCGQDKPLAEYYSGKQPCRSCVAAQQKARRAADPEAARERSRAYDRTYRERHHEILLPRDRAKKRAAYEADPETRRARARAYALKAATETARTADRSDYEWTGPELEIATRPDLTARQAALILGRTYEAVKNARRRAA